MHIFIYIYIQYSIFIHQIRVLCTLTWFLDSQSQCYSVCRDKFPTVTRSWCVFRLLQHSNHYRLLWKVLFYNLCVWGKDCPRYYNRQNWHLTQACVGMLFWSFFLMSFVQCNLASRSIRRLNEHAKQLGHAIWRSLHKFCRRSVIFHQTGSLSQRYTATWKLPNNHKGDYC